MNWREAFIKQLLAAAAAEGTDFINEEDWTPEEWPEIKAAQDEAVRRWRS